MSKPKKTEEKRTLYVKFKDDDYGKSKMTKKVTIPAGCKVTFGPLCPGTKGGNNGSEATALRIYNGASQIAVFVKVESFYEVDSVSVIQKVSKKAAKVQQVDEDGVKKNQTVTVEVSKWEDELDEQADDGEAKQVFAALKADHNPF